jgi:hypothetical protein
MEKLKDHHIYYKPHKNDWGIHSYEEPDRRFQVLIMFS